MSYLVTGAAGFIGFHVARRLLDRGDRVTGIDNLNSYYDVNLKRARLGLLESSDRFTFHRINIADPVGMQDVFNVSRDIDRIIHLAAQPGVRYSLTEPLAYIEANIKAKVVLLEAALTLPSLKSLVYASSSSVYGTNEKQPFRVEDRADHPASLYGATKRAGELIVESYCRVHHLSTIGLRFFTVYGPWGRPDMAPYLFTEAIAAGRPIRVFNDGRMERDFTYIHDVVEGIIAASALALLPGEHRLYNIGNNRPEKLLDFIAILEEAIGRPAIKELLPMQPGDVPSTYADIDSARRDLGFEPRSPITLGLPRFVDWFRGYYGMP